MDKSEFIFTISSSGAAEPMLPYNSDGSDLIADGITYFTIEEAARITNQPERALEEDYRTMFDGLLDDSRGMP